MTHYKPGVLETNEMKPATASYRCSRGHQWVDTHPGEGPPMGAITVHTGALRGLWCAQCILEAFAENRLTLSPARWETRLSLLCTLIC